MRTSARDNGVLAMLGQVDRDGEGVTVEGKGGSPDGLLWIGQAYPEFFCGRSRSCVRPGTPEGPHCFVHEAERRGVSRRVSHIPPWAVPGKTRIFLTHRGGERDAARGRIFGFFVLNRVEVLTHSGELVPPSGNMGSRDPQTADPGAKKDRPDVRTERCWDGREIVTHVYDRRRNRWVRTHEECPDPPELPDECDEDPVFADCPDGRRIATHICVDGEWHATSAQCPEPVPIEDERLVDYRGCGRRLDAGAIYLVDELAAGIADAFSDRLAPEPSREGNDIATGRRLFNEVVEDTLSQARQTIPVPTALSGMATVHGGLVLFNDPPLFENYPKASSRSLAHIDGNYLLEQIAAEVRKPAIRTVHEGGGIMTQGEIVATLAERAHANQAFTRQLLVELSDLAQEELEINGVFRLPGLGTLRRRRDGELQFAPYKALRESGTRGD